jgi:RNA polymerase sigma-70 factor (ECF subfamily)
MHEGDLHFVELTDLIDRCRSGDELAWEALVRRFQGRVYGLSLFYLGNAEEARDLAQDVFIRLYRRLDRCTNDETFVPWMLQITRNAAIDRLRRIKARPATVSVPVDEMLDLASSDLHPDEEWRRNRKRDLVHRALDRLSRINREIVILKEIQGQSLETIASFLNLPLGTVKSRSHRARIELAREVRALTEEEPTHSGGGFQP